MVGVRWKEGERPSGSQIDCEAVVKAKAKAVSRPLAVPKDIDAAREANARFYAALIHQEYETLESYMSAQIEYSSVKSEQWRHTYVYRKDVQKGRPKVVSAFRSGLRSRNPNSVGKVMTAFQARQHGNLAKRWSLFEEVRLECVLWRINHKPQPTPKPTPEPTPEPEPNSNPN